MGLPPLQQSAPMVACPWCWEPGAAGFRLLDGLIEEHDDIAFNQSQRPCRGSGRTRAAMAEAVAVHDLCRRILERAGYPDWTVRWSSAAPSICVHDAKAIWMYDQRHTDPWYYIKEAFLHEVAHIDTLRPFERSSQKTRGEQFHGPAFFRRLGELHQQCADIELEP